MTLSDRERFIMHSMSVMSIDGLVKQYKDDSHILDRMLPLSENELAVVIEDIRKGRCRGINREEVWALYDEMKEEMLLGSEIHRESMEREDYGR